MLLQQEHAKPISGEELEALGKKASATWRAGQVPTLSEAVVGTVKHAGLSPEQVKRVIEFCNQDAFLQEFKKEGAHKYVVFEGGPADPSTVLKDLNDGGGGTVFDSGMGDYNQPPEALLKAGSPRQAGLEKTASQHSPDPHRYEEQLYRLFESSGEELPHADPYEPLVTARAKLAGACGEAASRLSSLEVDFHDVSAELLYETKQACLSGTSLSQVARAFGEVTDNAEHIKVAFAILAPALIDGGVFSSKEALNISLEQKVAANVVVDTTHPLVQSFSTFVSTFNKIAAVKEIKVELDEGLHRAELLLKEALGGVVGKAWRGLGSAGQAVGGAVSRAGDVLLGSGAVPEEAAKLWGKRVAQGAGALGAGLAGRAAVQEVTDRPAAQRLQSAAFSLIPGTQEDLMRRQRIMMGG